MLFTLSLFLMLLKHAVYLLFIFSSLLTDKPEEAGKHMALVADEQRNRCERRKNLDLETGNGKVVKICLLMSNFLTASVCEFSMWNVRSVSSLARFPPCSSWGRLECPNFVNIAGCRMNYSDRISLLNYVRVTIITYSDSDIFGSVLLKGECLGVTEGHESWNPNRCDLQYVVDIFII